MRKAFVIFAVLLLGLLVFSGCDQEKATERMLAAPEMANMLMQKMWQNPDLKAKMLDMAVADTAAIQMMMDKVIASPEMSKMMIDKLSANAECFKMMQEVTKKRK